MAHYKPIRPWCELVLGQHMPLALRGKTNGISLLFPMEKLFERYVECNLRQQLRTPYTLKPQAQSQSLCTHKDKSIFQLRPDFVVLKGQKTVLVLDTKWKLISTVDSENKNGLNQGDFYQLFAYGHKYLKAQGEMLLIYPLTEHFSSVLPPFDFSPDLLRLWVAPFDLENNKMIWPDHLKMQPFNHDEIAA
jgi:5-methylcytosine-specific restriction enzyme subunit McrC